MSDNLNAATVRLLGGKLCLDFVNTVEPRIGDHRSGYLISYVDLVQWARHAGSLSEDRAQSLLLEADNRYSEAAVAIKQAVALRETVYQVFLAVAREDEPDPSDLEALSTAHVRALAHYRIMRQADGFGWVRAEDKDELEYPLWPVVLSATELLTTGNLERVKECPPVEGGCGWLFYDRSKNKSRRWCEMADCGSRVKMRRLYARKRADKTKGDREDQG